ncbi:hypothetical protein [Henriciella aquimarina]|uniref:hypothetical protein n=1 Tax=Henriciella aquimarina TaxID=545261 RepID=UPI000A0638BE|nr:hypothetical protein [Henriciella aquimarina]
MKRALILTVSLSLLAVSACSSTSKETGSQTASQPAAKGQGAASGLIPAVNVVPESGLGPQQLESNECGLFLWSKTDATQFIFFEKSQTGRATMKLGAETVELVQTVNSGVIFGEFMTEQGFAAPGGEQVMLTIVPGDELQGGQRVESGRLTVTTPEGWRTVIPVLGVRACEP